MNFVDKDGTTKVYIPVHPWSLSRLLKSSNTKRKCKQLFCMNCLQGFTQESSRDQHEVYCEDNESVRVEMPKQGSTVELDRINLESHL